MDGIGHDTTGAYPASPRDASPAPGRREGERGPGRARSRSRRSRNVGRARPREEDVVLYVYVLVHLRLELAKAVPERAPGRACPVGGHEVVGQLADARERRPRALVLVLHDPDRVTGLRPASRADEREEDDLFLVHVIEELRVKRPEYLHQLAQHLGHLLAVHVEDLPGHRLEPGELLAERRMVGGLDVGDELVEARLVPGAAGRPGVGELGLDLPRDPVGVEPPSGAGVGEGTTAAAAEVDLVPGEDAGAPGMLRGDGADRGLGMNGDGHQDLLSRARAGAGGSCGGRRSTISVSSAPFPIRARSDAFWCAPPCPIAA